MGDAFDLVVIGAGPGGYAAAIRAAQLGLRAACVDERPRPGGTCLNVGCIPSKALLDASRRFREARHVLGAHGADVEDVLPDLAVVMGQKEDAVERLTSGVAGLFRKHGIEHVAGRGRLAGKGEVSVAGGEGGERTLRAERVILAPGSRVVRLPDVEVDEERIVTSTGSLAFAEVPEHLVVIGAGYIGLEMGSVWARLGARVTCIEVTNGLLPGMDRELGEALRPLLEEQGFAFRLETRVVAARADAHGVALELADAGAEDDGDAEEMEASHVLLAVGREPATDDLGLEEAGVETDERGFVRTDDRFRTSVERVYAVGDAVREPMLAHKAIDEALACVEAITGHGPGVVDLEAVPAIVYTHPEVASVGRSEDALRREDAAYRVGRASFAHNPRARCIGEAEGFVKILADERSDLLLGAHVVGPDAGSVIHELVLTRKFGGSVEELGRATHGHPTVNEAVREAALAVHGRPVHG